MISPNKVAPGELLHSILVKNVGAINLIVVFNIGKTDCHRYKN